MRPVERLHIDDEHPRDRYMHWVIEALGGTVVDYAGVYKCCGFPIITMNKQASLAQAGRHVGDAIDAEADCLVVPCPLCHLNLDLQQPLAAKRRRPRAGTAGASSAAARRARARPVAEGARDEQARRPADIGDRLVDVGGGRLSGRVIGTLRRVLSSALGVGREHAGELPSPAPPRRARRRGSDADRRIEDARRRLKATIPPPED